MDISWWLIVDVMLGFPDISVNYNCTFCFLRYIFIACWIFDCLNYALSCFMKEYIKCAIYNWHTLLICLWLIQLCHYLTDFDSAWHAINKDWLKCMCTFYLYINKPSSSMLMLLLKWYFVLILEELNSSSLQWYYDIILRNW